MIHKLIRWIFKHRHVWVACGWNCWGIAIEQKCKCGAYRHHTFRDLPKNFCDEPYWREGQHTEAHKPLATVGANIKIEPSELKPFNWWQETGDKNIKTSLEPKLKDIDP